MQIKKNHMLSIKMILSGLFLCLSLTACTSFLPRLKEPPSLHMLTPVTKFDPSLPKVKWDLAVERPYGGGLYDTARLAVTTDYCAVSYLKGIKWVDRLPIMLQDLLVKSFENTHSIVGVSSSVTGIAADYSLLIDIRRFLIDEQKDPSVAVVHVFAKLLDMKTRRIVRSINIKEKAPIANLTSSCVVPSFKKATHAMINRLTQWLLKGQ